MTQFYAITGVATVILLSLAALVGTVSWFMSIVRDNRWDRWLEQRLKAAREIGQEIASSAHWFGEHPPSVKLLESIGREYFNRGQFDAAQIRSEWRNHLPQKEKPLEEIPEMVEIAAQWLNSWNKPRTSRPEDNIDFHSISEHAQNLYRGEAVAFLKALPRRK